MLFTGDIALPSPSIRLPKNLPQGKTWIGNLEGCVVKHGNEYLKDSGVFNDFETIKQLRQMVPFKAFGIANNHLMDFADVQTTLNNASELEVPVFGAGNCLKQAQQSLIVTDEEESVYRLLAFGWGNISCSLATKMRQGVNPYTKANVLFCVEEALKQKEPVVCFMHWNYELEAYPQPYDRQLAHELIDMGVCAVIGCHAHRVQPVEFYKGRPIVYGLGNFLFCQGQYCRGGLRFPQFCEEEYVFEISDGGEKFHLHYFKYDPKKNGLEFEKSIQVKPDMEFVGKAIFSGFSAKEYEAWFKKNRTQKTLLPIFRSKESELSYLIKSVWIKTRGTLIVMLSKLNIKRYRTK